MGITSALMLLFVWLKVGDVIDLSWWWILTPFGVDLVLAFWGALV